MGEKVAKDSFETTLNRFFAHPITGEGDTEEEKEVYKLALASVIGHGTFLFVMIVNAIYIFGIMFRDVRHLFCRGCGKPAKRTPMIESTTL